MFDLDSFVGDCIEARRTSEPRLAIREVLDRAMRERSDVAAALPPTKAEIVPLHISDELTVLKVAWAPHMHLGPHDHRMWAAIGMYAGAEDDALYRRSEATLVQSGGRELRPGDVFLLGDDAIHAVTNPSSAQHAGAIHVYGGDFFQMPRSEWLGDPYREQPYDVDRVLAVFAQANADTGRP